VGVLIGFGVVEIAKAAGLGQGGDGFLVAGEEVPTILRPGPIVFLQIRALFVGGEVGSFAGVEADGDDVEVFSYVERKGFEGRAHSVEGHGAEHGAAVVDEGENGGLAVDQILELNVFAELIAEDQVEGELGVEVLIDADFVEDLG
jgi:hypothetical protein